MLTASTSRVLLPVRRSAVKAIGSSRTSSQAIPHPALAGSSRWASSGSNTKDNATANESGSVEASSSTTSASPAASSSSTAASGKPMNRKQRFAHKIPQPNQEALLRRPISSTTASQASSRAVASADGKAQETEPLPPFTLNDFASMSSLLYQPDPILDSGITYRVPPTADNPFPSSITIFNEHPETGGPVFPPTPPSASSLVVASASGGGSQEVDSAAYLASVTPLSAAEVNALHRHTLVIKRVVRMTTKGKVASMYALVVAGNGKGMVGYGEGKDTNAGKAARKAFHEAVKKMDYVKRFEGRTIQSECTSKWGASKVTLRPRPAGFGLRVPPAIHSLARAAGIADLSASIRGSANPLNVVKAVCQMLWSGSLPSGLGDGVGGPGRRNDKGRGMPDIREIELARGRKLREVRLGS